MQSFSVYVEFDVADVSPDTYPDLFDALQDQHGAVGPADSGNLSARLTIEAGSALQAAALGIEHTQNAITAHGITQPAVAVEVVTEAERDRRLTDEDQEEGPGPATAGAGEPCGQFSVYVEFDTTDVSVDTYTRLLAPLHDAHGAAGPAPNGNLSVRLTMQAGSIMQAAMVGVHRAQATTTVNGLAPTVIGIKARVTAEHDRLPMEESQDEKV
ncbi:hypothetical protein [Streptomyces decoyicus]|uniref:hypothetical protein n=1 Tax=Streptomyces decoyicus TaxID=249567 RepID=UPI00366450F2